MRAVPLFLVALAAVPAFADDRDPPTPFDRGHISLFAGGGRGTSLGYNYVIVGAGVGYFVLDGLEVSLHADHQFGDGPSISEVSPELRYVVKPLLSASHLLPYVGASYHHWFVGDVYDDVDAVAGRAGALWFQDRVVFGVGAIFEHVVSDCISHCNSVYPDITLGFTI